MEIIEEINDKNVEQQRVEEGQIKFAEEAKQVRHWQVQFKIVELVKHEQLKQQVEKVAAKMEQVPIMTGAALIKVPMVSPDDSVRVQYVPGTWPIDTVVANIEQNGNFPTDFELYVKRVFKVARSTTASMLLEMLKTVLGNMMVPFMATDTMRSLAYAHRALGEFDHGNGSIVVTVHNLLALKLEPAQRAVLDSLTEDSLMPRTSNPALQAMEPLFWRRGEAKDFTLFDDFVAALERYMKHAPGTGACLNWTRLAGRALDFSLRCAVVNLG
ncbi:hypothetical protein AMAG_06360 [Allomyces macrogynus ATCC 38327]|uniref:Uncharacterized protein n=1 Tax=Allomyces macrogynus (strain ATCC 38327) TaxID=578462 RepID=A0A0L0SGA0_ALLM3|nr:hypothetical protein AMAG_06360 [Allomyces macrogynus ATCC 38327]|eukprot:KNE61541.1 hypothetical protein AMAG_06360 [Allomyces macrogynus ATCC 38327]